jgi:hypothetical protein
MADLVGAQKARLNEDLKAFAGDLANLDTVTKADIVAALNELRARMADLCLTAAGLQIGTTSKKEVRINATTTTYTIGGVFKSKSAAEVAFTATTHDIAADASNVKEAVYTMSLQADGTATLTMGTIATGAGNAVVPEGPAGEVVIGHVRIAVDAGATPFDATTDDLDATHLTVTYTDVSFLE